MSDQSFATLRRIDQVIFTLEQRLVSVAAMLMTTTVCLDIIYRSLKGQQSEPFFSIMNLYGSSAKQITELPFSIAPVISLVLVPFGLGWAVYASLHRGEEGNVNKALINGVWWSLGGVFSALLIYHCPSKYVCLLLCVIVGGLISFKTEGMERLINGALTALVGVGCLSLPQGYIWSQELSLILLAWVAFLGASMATFQNKHIQISALVGLIPEKFKPYIRPIGLIATSLFCAYITISLSMSVFGSKGSFFSGETRPATGIPAWVILFSGVVSFTLITLRSFAYGFWGLMHPDQQPEEELGH